MKKTSVILVAVIVALTLCACEGPKPERLSQRDYDKAKEVVKIVDDVLDGKNDASNLGISFDVKGNSIEDSLVQAEVRLLIWEVQQYRNGGASSDSVKEKRNDLARTLNMDAR